MDWLDALTTLRERQLELAQLDARRAPPPAPPPGAVLASVAMAERRIGMALPPSYRAFLAVHDGWPGFFHEASLLGARQLGRGPLLRVARDVLDRCETPLPELTPVAPREARTAPLVPFGVDARAEVILAWDPASMRPDGEMGVVLWANEIGEQMETFPDLVAFVVEVVEAEIAARRTASAACVTLPAAPGAVSLEEYLGAIEAIGAA